MGLTPTVFLSPEDAAQRASFSRKVIYRAIEEGELRAYRCRGRLRIAEPDFETWMRAVPVTPRDSGAADAAIIERSRRSSPRSSFRSILAASDRNSQ